MKNIHFRRLGVSALEDYLEKNKMQLEVCTMQWKIVQLSALSKCYMLWYTQGKSPISRQLSLVWDTPERSRTNAPNLK